MSGKCKTFRKTGEILKKIMWNSKVFLEIQFILGCAVKLRFEYKSCGQKCVKPSISLVWTFFLVTMNVCEV